ncbi:MAG TPA: ComEC/Rec2 family competence protein [Pseudacidobacterium sp.]|nr:ComEC/Rec2 family competence protein [Pseudacidobacterium sp.]
MPQTSPHTEPLRFSHLPLLFAVICFACGIYLSRLIWIAPAFFIPGIFLCAAICGLSIYKAPRISLLPLAVLFLLLGAFCAESAPMADPQTQLTLLADGTSRTVEGEVGRLSAVRHVESTVPFSNKTRTEQTQQLQIRLTSVSMDDGSRIPLTGGLSLGLYAPLDAAFPFIICGDIVRVTVAMRLPDRYLDPGVWDERTYLLGQGIGAIGSSKSDAVTILRKAQHRSILCRLHSLQQKASTRLIAFAENTPSGFFRLDREDATMLTAMLTGDRSYLSRGVRTGFERTGSFHLLVVSGMHLAIFAGFIFFITRALQIPRGVSTFATIAIAFAYALFTGYGQPVQRSFWMITLFLLGRLLWRERSALNAIGFAALVLLVVNPQALFDAGFQMTLLTVLATAGVAIPIAEKSFAPYLAALRNLWLLPLDPALPPKVTQFRISLRLMVEHTRLFAGRYIAALIPFVVKIFLRVLELLLVSIIIELIMSLPMALYFHRITASGLPVNLLIVPLLGILLPSAIVTLLTVVIAPAVAFVPAFLTASMLHLALIPVQGFAYSTAGDLRIPTPSWIAIAGWMISIAFAIWIVRQKKVAIAAAFMSLAIGAVIAIHVRKTPEHHGQLEITVIDVGQGDCLLAISPEGKTLLIDAGGIVGASPDSKVDIGEDVVSQTLWSRGFNKLDAVAITHAHADHIGGMPAVLENFHPNELWIGRNPDSPAYNRILREAAALGIHVRQHRAGDTFPFGSIGVRVLSPAADYTPKFAPSNDDSLVLRVSYGSTSALLEGDAEAPSESRMVAEGNIHSDLLKVGHHGSKTSTTPAFLQAVSPSYAAISVGRHNYYGHPKLETLEKLENAHAFTYRTDLLGASTFYLDGKHITTATWDKSESR